MWVPIRDCARSGLPVRDCARSGLCPFGIVPIRDGALLGSCTRSLLCCVTDNQSRAKSKNSANVLHFTKYGGFLIVNLIQPAKNDSFLKHLLAQILHNAHFRSQACIAFYAFRYAFNRSKTSCNAARK